MPVNRATKERRKAAEQRAWRLGVVNRGREARGEAPLPYLGCLEGQAPVTSESYESARERIPTREVPVTSMREMLDQDELEAELAQHAEAGR